MSESYFHRGSIVVSKSVIDDETRKLQCAALWEDNILKRPLYLLSVFSRVDIQYIDIYCLHLGCRTYASVASKLFDKTGRPKRHVNAYWNEARLIVEQGFF